MTTPNPKAAPYAAARRTGESDAHMAPLIELTGCSKRYGNVLAVDDVSLALVAGEFMAITGPSGSGKSTLLGLLGLLETPTAGTYSFRGTRVTEFDDRETSRLRNRSFGFVFQQFHLLPELSAWENVSRPLVYANVPRRERRQRAAALLERFGLGARAEHRPAQLSGGEQQRVAIARALVNDPDVILADEPTGNLPREQWAPVLAALAELNAEGKTVVIVTHEPEVAAAAQREVAIHDGRLVGA